MTENTSTPEQMNGFIVLIEWDGNKPPTRWYSFLARYGLNIGQGGVGDKFANAGKGDRISPIARRMAGKNSNPYGVAFQEGAIVVNSGDMARRLASNARYFGATSVSIGSVSLNPYSMTPEDEQALSYALAVTSKRGPKASQKKDAMQSSVPKKPSPTWSKCGNARCVVLNVVQAASPGIVQTVAELSRLLTHRPMT